MHTELIAMALLALLAAPSAVRASSHMDAPLITLDDAANTTDVYAFVTTGAGGRKYLTTALSVYPFEEPGIGPNQYDFDDRVLYDIHVALGEDLPAGRPTLSYLFDFSTRYKNRGTILSSYTGVVRDVDDPNQNRTEDYTVKLIDNRPGRPRVRLLARGVVPPNNQGLATPEYNTAGGAGPAKDGVATAAELDKYTVQTVTPVAFGHVAFAGQRDDGFYGDIEAVFDLLSLRGPGAAVDAQRGFNVHTIVLQIPVDFLGGDLQSAGVWATTQRRQIKVRFSNQNPVQLGEYVQVGRQGNPLFCEGFVALQDKDAYNRSSPEVDSVRFRKYAENPELAALLNALVFPQNPIPGIEHGRTDLAGIFIPDLIKVDLSTAAVPLAGGGPGHPTNPDDPGFSRLSVFGGDTIFSPLQQTMIPSGWPNGRRFGDDVVDIGVSAVLSDLRARPPVIRTAGDNVDGNDIAYSKVMPYAATPLSGRSHQHH